MMKSFKTYLVLAAYFICAGLINSAVAASLTQRDVFAILKTETVKVFGTQRADLYSNDVSITDTMFLLLGLNSEPSVMDNGYVFMEGCRVHSCVEKAATIVDPQTKRMLALALLNFNCHLTMLTQDDLTASAKNNHRNEKHTCDSQAKLDIFLARKKSHLIDESRLVDTLRVWGKKFGYANENIRIIVRR